VKSLTVAPAFPLSFFLSLSLVRLSFLSRFRDFSLPRFFLTPRSSCRLCFGSASPSELESLEASVSGTGAATCAASFLYATEEAEGWGGRIHIQQYS
jgi:hypothetical protein